MRTCLLCVATILFAATAVAADDPVVPEGVRYKKASAEVNGRAEKNLLRVFTADAADKDVLDFFQKRVLICGPGLWQEIKGEPAVAKMVEGKVDITVPVLDGAGKPTGRDQKLKGQLFQTGEEVLAFWKAFCKHAEFTDTKVRKLTTEELKIYWAMISFDISEPVFVVEGKRHRILVQFTSPDDLRVMWIDDLANLRLVEDTGKPQKAGDKGEKE
jgi:hypothetical protein